MKKLLALLAGAFITLGTSAAWGGMIMTETESTVSGTTPRTAQRTVMIEGNREKMITERNQIITDLDKGVIYIINPAEKNYLEMPFPPQGPMKNMIGGPAMHTNFTKTGKSRTVAGYKCEEYTGTGKFMMADFSVVSCVSPSAPGAKDFEKFERAMMSKLKGSSLELPNNLPEGVPLAQDTTTKMTAMGNMPNLPPEAAAQLKQQMANRPPVVTKSEVTKIATQKIADNEFQIPAGFTKRENPMMGMGHGGMGGMGAHPGMGTGGHPGAGAPPASAPSPGQ